MGSTNMEILLQVSSVVKDIRVDMLSDDNFTNVSFFLFFDKLI